ncbi:GGDEF domain-containing protein [Lichenifustis flavocetrariae]|uniref:diguanylate cyclase n=1 Tax=Lichenifustis flavocetrariae TaxID=2949735 RepID=A0AA41Z6F9_9HYPH|nr:GGDEF domain-containing protein [Lichenifustis flavocetrariae]MCW6510137.1 GGDEF domain-containing protein [Lichenifustis flavocetrariae]
MIPGILYPPHAIAPLERSWHLCCHGDPRGALEDITEVLARFESIGDTAAIAVAKLQHAWFCFQLGHVEEGVGVTTAALAIWRESENQVGIAMATAMRAWLLLEAGVADQAVEAAAVALSMAETGQDMHASAFATNVAGVVQWYCQHPDRALELCERALDIAQTLGSTETVAWWMINVAGIHAVLATVARQRGDEATRQAQIARAIELNEHAIGLAERQGDLWCLHLGLCNAAEYLIVDDPHRARQALERCAKLPLSPLGARSHVQLSIQQACLLVRDDRHNEAVPICLATLENVGENAEARAIAHLCLSEIYEKSRDFECALKHLKLHHETLARISAESTQRRARIANILCQTQSLQDAVRAAQEQAAMLSDAILRDPLTNLYNRRAFDTIIPSLIRDAGSFAVAMFDLDHFKSINDRFTHTTGDDVLRTVAGLFKNIPEASDLAVRMGGEEFCLLFIGRDAATVCQSCERIRRSVAETDWAVLKAGLRVTVSIGVAMGGPGGDLMQIVRLADERLYTAKTNGRNRVVGVFEGDSGAISLVA